MLLILQSKTDKLEKLEKQIPRCARNDKRVSTGKGAPNEKSGSDSKIAIFGERGRIRCREESCDSHRDIGV